MMRRILSLFLALAAAAVLSAQSPQRDPSARQITPGTGVISGALVTDDANAKPLRMANVTLSGSALAHFVLTTTDDEGRFAFRNLPAGSFTVAGEKAGYVQMEYGAVRPNGDGLPIVLEPGGQAHVTLKLPKGAAISGIVTTAAGEPVADARMFLMQSNPTQNGGRSIGPPRGVSGWHWQLRSDDRGQYRFYGLPAGDYYILCQPGSLDQDVRLLGASDFDWARTLLQPSASGITPPPSPPRQSVSYAAVLYPGVADPSAAAPVTVAAGEDRAGIDFPVPPVPTSNIGGLVRDPSGRPAANAQVNLLTPSVSLFLRDLPSTRAAADGTFRLAGVLPGAYALAARGNAQQPGSAGTWALFDLNVDGREIARLDVSLQTGMTITGRVAFDGTAAPPADLKSVRVSLGPAGDTVMFGSGTTPVSADGTFTIIGVSPGQYRLGGTAPRGSGGAASPWSLRSTSSGNVDMFDHPFDVRPGMSLADAVVTFTDRTAEISGKLLDAAGQPAPQYFVVVFPTDKALWSTRSRRVKSVRPGANGTYRVAGLPAGEYFVAAVAKDSDDLYMPAFLDPLIAASSRITIGEGEKKVQDFQIKGSGVNSTSTRSALPLICR